MGAELIHAMRTGRQTDVTKLIDDFRDPAKAGKNAVIFSYVKEYQRARARVCIYTHTHTVIPRLTSDTANEFFG